MRTLSKRNRDRLTALARYMPARIATMIRAQVKARTPRRGARKPKDRPYDPAFAQRGTHTINVNLPPRLAMSDHGGPTDANGAEVEA